MKVTQSMYELDGSLQRRRRQSTGGVLDKKRLAVARLNSATSQEDHCVNGHGSNKPTTSTSNLFSRQRSVRKSDAPGHPISAIGREIIQFCFENAHPDLGFRICNRVFDKRPDYQRFVHQLGKEKWLLMTQSLKEFLDKVVAKIDNLETVERLSRKYGEEHVPLKNYGFKPDFWVTLADAITVEAVILDMATHQPTDTVTACHNNCFRNSSSKPSTPTTPHPPKGNNNSLQSALAAPPRKDSTGSNRLEAKLSAGSGEDTVTTKMTC
uniref:Globin family profile domain-containing protein n=1 Tax=Ditylenchus dipsaci TaxID=166011 RepID=A0A915DL84_9BILA